MCKIHFYVHGSLGLYTIIMSLLLYYAVFKPDFVFIACDLKIFKQQTFIHRYTVGLKHRPSWFWSKLISLHKAVLLCFVNCDISDFFMQARLMVNGIGAC